MRTTCVFVMIIVMMMMSSIVSAQLQPDETQLMQFFTPPTNQAPSPSSPLEAWQAQQAGVQANPAPAPAAAGVASLLSEFAAFLQSKVASSAPAQAPSAAPALTFDSNSNMQSNANMYGASNPAPPAAGISLIDASPRSTSPQPSTDIFPLSHGSGYGFDRPPADVQAAIKRAQPKKLSDVEVFSRIPNRSSLDRVKPFRNHYINLESQLRSHPDAILPVPKKQAPFKIRTHRRRAPALHIANVATSLLESEQSDNPFLKDEPSLLEAEEALKSADSTMTPFTSQFIEHAAQRQAHVDAPAPAQAVEESPVSMIEQSASSTVTSAASASVAFPPTPARAVPSANFSKMFQSIMQQLHNKKALVQEEQN